MRRRDFVKGIAGAIGWPIAVRAQQPDRQRRIGVLLPSAKDDPEYQPWLTAFRQTLQELGWAEGRKMAFPKRSSGVYRSCAGCSSSREIRHSRTRARRST
jgi:hypothetical protein